MVHRSRPPHRGSRERPATGVRSPAIVHGDLTGNVLFDPVLPPAVIDLTVDWRPVNYSIAVIAIDAVCFEGAPMSLLETISPVRDFPQYLVRALLFRLVADCLNGRPASAVLCCSYSRTVPHSLNAWRWPDCLRGMSEMRWNANWHERDSARESLVLRRVTVAPSPTRCAHRRDVTMCGFRCSALIGAGG
jgi:hypothetical protein